jgi:zinc protease
MFRVGIGDEPLYRRGYTHLVEHLTLRDYDNPKVQWNGFVDLSRTVFHATGPQVEVVARQHDGTTGAPV